MEKLAAEQLSQYYESYSKLYSGQISTQKERSVIDVVAILINPVKKSYQQKKLAITLFIDVKRTFDHISKTQIITCMIELEINGSFVS